MKTCSRCHLLAKRQPKRELKIDFDWCVINLAILDGWMAVNINIEPIIIIIIITSSNKSASDLFSPSSSSLLSSILLPKYTQ
ncbi:hypothetical protein DERP_011456 [Dermatophagoides pteronyssinus]|uniref:Uncharacterized protein n=1 Tax=Dermatophagoides pteronyssinus TaxID=6956 RepID=A0ABQ8J5H5_DERPT|nr:hypothetical protein DERP_011456 [Dermatophagoides pteronyssinus]